MSGVCGIVDLGGASIVPGQLSLMTEKLKRRGPDGIHIWHKGSVALGHSLLATTPESLVETLPLCDPYTGCVITADVRLDNRETLLQALGLAGCLRVVGDGELILGSYLLWGDTCVDHLLGDFAFAIWDPRTARLFCARDHFGMRQLTFCHIAGAIFAFATEPRAILSLERVPRRIDEGRIADFLEGELECIDQTSTFFEGIFRLPPAHSLTLDASGLRIKRYWALTPGPELKLPSDEAYAAAFLEVFTEAVRCRLRSNGPVGSMLSGGMDSGSVVAVASRLLAEEGRGPLQTFSALGPDQDSCVETRAIHAALSMPGLDPHLINHADLGNMVPDLVALTEQIDEPFDGHMTLPRAVYISANRAEIKVMLDGVAGDIVLTHGSQITRLLRSGRWRQALRDARGEARFWGSGWSAWNALASGAWRAFVPNWLRRFRRKVFQSRAVRRISDDSIINPDFARRINLAARWERYRGHSIDESMTHAEERAVSITGPKLTVGRERYDRVASASKIEPRDPFLDLRVVAFCLTLPGSQLEADGWPKLILRRAMAGQLPDSVRWRRGKEHLGWKFTQTLLAAWPGWRRTIMLPGQPVGSFVRPETLAAVGHRDIKLVDSERSADVLSLALWLNRVSGDHTTF